MRFLSGDEFLGPRLRDDPAGPAAIADIGDRLIHNDRFDVDVRNIHIGDIVDGPVVKEISIIPVPALIARAGITKPISYAAIKTDVRSPIPVVEYINAIAPAPVSWRP